VTAIPDPFQVRIAQVALGVAARYGFALGGGHALVAHGLVHRATEDVDLFTDVDGGVRAATEAVRDALVGAGYTVQSPEDLSELTDLFYGMDDAFTELDVREGAASSRISLGSLPRQRTPVVMAVGPVLDLEDLLRSKVCALGTRSQVRDYVDVAAAIGSGYDRLRLTAMAQEIDRDLTAEDFAVAMRRLDALPDAAFVPYGLGAEAVAELRERFADWPREDAESHQAVIAKD
jgi:Nucleotidyl transferase AbiEii toxin, Type IV TA system